MSIVWRPDTPAKAERADGGFLTDHAPLDGRLVQGPAAFLLRASDQRYPAPRSPRGQASTRGSQCEVRLVISCLDYTSATRGPGNTQENQADDRVTISASQWQQIVNSAVDTAIINIDQEGRITSWK